jgi:hypothetical protein
MWQRWRGRLSTFPFLVLGVVLSPLRATAGDDPPVPAVRPDGHAFAQDAARGVIAVPGARSVRIVGSQRSGRNCSSRRFPHGRLLDAGLRRRRGAIWDGAERGAAAE